jgi:hypothetical protein
MTVKTVSAGNVEWQNNPVAFFYAPDSFTHFLDYAHDFMAYDRAFFEGRTPVVHM